MTDTPPELPAHFSDDDVLARDIVRWFEDERQVGDGFMDGPELLSMAECMAMARHFATEAVRCALAARPAAVAVEPPKPVAWCALTQSGQIAYFDGKPMVMPGPVGNDCHPTPLYAAAPPQDARDAARYRQALVDICARTNSAISYDERAKACFEIANAALTKEQP